MLIPAKFSVQKLKEKNLKVFNIGVDCMNCLR